MAATPWGLDPAREADWDALYADQLPRVYNFLRYRVGDDVLAEDLTSIAFEKAWVARHRYRRDRAGFSTWLFTIARNVAVDHWRRRRPHEPLEAAAEVPDPTEPSRIVERRESHARLVAALATLPDRDRELIALKYGAELTNIEIAHHTGLTANHVGTLLHRAVGRLREQLGPQED